MVGSPPAPGQQALADTLASAINHPQNIGLTVTSGDSGVIFGQYISATIDIGDIAQVGSGAGVSALAILAHEVAGAMTSRGEKNELRRINDLAEATEEFDETSPEGPE